MRRETICVKRGDVLRQVNMLTAYEAAHVERAVDKQGRAVPSVDFGMVATGEAQEELLVPLVDSAVGELCEILAGYNAVGREPEPSSDGEYSIELELPDTFQGMALSNIRKHAFMYVVYVVCRDWFGISLPSLMQKYVQLADLAHEHISVSAKGRTKFPMITPDVM